MTLEASREVAKPKTMLKPRKVRPASVLVNLITISVAGVFWRQEEEGRDLRGLSRLQQEDPAHGLASAGERHRGGSYQQSLSVSRELLTSSSSPSTSNVLATRVGCCCDYVAGYVSLKNE